MCLRNDQDINQNVIELTQTYVCRCEDGHVGDAAGFLHQFIHSLNLRLICYVVLLSLSLQNSNIDHFNGVRAPRS